MENLTELVTKLSQLPAETEWVEFKHNKYTPDMIGEDISALANGATLSQHPFAYLIWGIDDSTHEILGTTNEWHAMKKGSRKSRLGSGLLSPLTQNWIFSLRI